MTVQPSLRPGASHEWGRPLLSRSGSALEGPFRLQSRHRSGLVRWSDRGPGPLPHLWSGLSIRSARFVRRGSGDPTLSSRPPSIGRHGSPGRGAIALPVAILADVGPLWKFPTEEDRVAVERDVNELMARAGAPEIAIATSGLLDEIEETRVIPANEVGPVHDWASGMGSTPSAAESAPDCPDLLAGGVVPSPIRIQARKPDPGPLENPARSHRRRVGCHGYW